MRIYISGPLQGSTDLATARRFYDALALLIRDAGHEAYVPHHSTDPVAAAGLPAQVVFATDLAALNSADAIIAHVGLPSTGVGAELALATASGRRVLGIKRPGEKGSRFAEGLIADGGGQVRTFADEQELREAVRNWLRMPAAWFGRPESIEPHRKVVA
ncbi:nucleoside 2-deoxyribosyltransferase [Microbacterium sp. BH-3-3-3]|uniref:nucleoside 2-deoxyribosyltransferase n=1 Tax=Microbacterium sp. BH-3-3-3 TaxID=1906742 RepID=UPI0008928650|nr:nucleoside 2-deoxyribosyltransferase [Microbacterium sp. BH-3-3-3]AOX45311.1 hypothetical protein BJP65_05440 [Microbacterium sp. BH-3-3-3]